MSKSAKTTDPIQLQINNILNENKLSDLRRFLEKRQCLNKTNIYLNYCFHFVQSAGIFTTTLAAGYNVKELVWGGIALNIIASLIHVFEQTNNTLSKRLMNDIIAIKKGKYIDEGLSVEPDKDDTKTDSKKDGVDGAVSSKLPIETHNTFEVSLLDGSNSDSNV